MSLLALNKTYRTLISDSITIDGEELNSNYIDFVELENAVNLLLIDVANAEILVDTNTNNITTNTNNIVTNTTTINNNSNDITNNALLITGNTTNIGNNTLAIGTNTTNIGSNTSNIGLNTTAISSNLTNITTNQTNIINNESNISTNNADIIINAGLISTNTSNITINAGLISTNATDITTNAGLISTNITNISTNAGLISTNTTNIDTNTTDIGTNTTNIGSNTTNIGSNTTNIINNATNIGNNTTNIGNNATNIGTNTTDIGANAGLIAVNTTNISTLSDNIDSAKMPHIFISSVDVPTFSTTNVKSWNDGLPTPNNNAILYGTETTSSSDVILHEFHVDETSNIIRIYGTDPGTIFVEVDKFTSITTFNAPPSFFESGLFCNITKPGKWFLCAYCNGEASGIVNGTDGTGGRLRNYDTLSEFYIYKVGAVLHNNPAQYFWSSSQYYIYDAPINTTIDFEIAQTATIAHFYPNTKLIAYYVGDSTYSFSEAILPSNITFGTSWTYSGLSITCTDPGIYLVIADMRLYNQNATTTVIEGKLTDPSGTIIGNTDNTILLGSYNGASAFSQKQCALRTIFQAFGPTTIRTELRRTGSVPAVSAVAGNGAQMHIVKIEKEYGIEYTPKITVIPPTGTWTDTFEVVISEPGYYHFMGELVLQWIINNSSEIVYTKLFNLTNLEDVPDSEAVVGSSTITSIDFSASYSSDNVYNITTVPTRICLMCKNDGVGNINVLNNTKFMFYRF